MVDRLFGVLLDQGLLALGQIRIRGTATILRTGSIKENKTMLAERFI